MTLLSTPAILRHMDLGSLVIAPFKTERLNTNSYDLELGANFWRHFKRGHAAPDQIRPSEGEFAFVRVDAREDGGLWLAPGERVLGHTVEIVGGQTAFLPAHMRRDHWTSEKTAVTTHLHATSTAGRHGLTVCQCAGFGDVGYVARWTLEIQNHTKSTFWLPVGAIICQMAFEQVEPPKDAYTGQYGRDEDNWTPAAMLPGNLKVA